MKNEMEFHGCCSMLPGETTIDCFTADPNHATQYFDVLSEKHIDACDKWFEFVKKIFVDKYTLEDLRKEYSGANAWAADEIANFLAWESEKFPKKNQETEKPRYANPATKALFDRAKVVDADYLDMNSGYIYRIQEYNRAKRFGLPPVVPGIRVFSLAGEYVGYVEDPNMIN